MERGISLGVGTIGGGARFASAPVRVESCMAVDCRVVVPPATAPLVRRRAEADFWDGFEKDFSTGGLGVKKFAIQPSPCLPALFLGTSRRVDWPNLGDGVTLAWRLGMPAATLWAGGALITGTELFFFFLPRDFLVVAGSNVRYTSQFPSSSNLSIETKYPS